MGKMNGEQAKHREEIAAFLRMLASHHETGLLVTYKEAEQYIELPSDKWASEHFGNLRGIDKHKDRSVIVVVGRLQVDPVHMEKMALGLFYDSALPITLTGKYEKRPVGFNMRNGAQNGVETDRHVCPIVDAVRWQHTEAEIIQAVDRLRLVHRPDKAAVYLMNEVPTSIAIDKLRSYREAVGRQGDKGAGGGPGWKLLQAYSELGNVLPASPEWLAKRFPHLWRSPNAAKMALRDYKKRTGNELGTLFGGARGFQLVMGKRRAASFLIWAPDPATAEAFHDANFE
ncbi:MAG: hypothetical protein E5W81_00695 [Mesorhizobium sp.]|nr:MAG: hypothetical protein E5W81_00695 [Mesorhizobium sp.]